MKDHFKKGAGEFIGFTITSVFLLALMLVFVSFSALENGTTAVEGCTSFIGRNIVVLNSIELARKQTKAQAEFMLSKYKNIKNIKTKVQFAPGCTKWEKGAFVRVTVSAKVKTYDPFTTKRHTYSTLVMVEKNSDEQLQDALDISMESTSNDMDDFFKCLEAVADDLVKYRFAKGDSGLSSTLQGAIRGNRECNCASYVSWAMQLYGVLPKGKLFYLNSDVRGGAASYIKSHNEKFKVFYPNKIPEACNLQPGDICGWSALQGGYPHTAVYKGNDNNGKPIWYAGGGDGVAGGVYTESRMKPKRRSYYEDDIVNVVIRIIPNSE